MGLDAIAKTVRLAHVDAGGVSARILGDEEIDAGSIKFPALQDFIERGTGCAQGPAAPLVDLSDAGSRGLVIVEKMNGEFHGLSIPSKRTGSRMRAGPEGANGLRKRLAQMVGRNFDFADFGVVLRVVRSRDR